MTFKEKFLTAILGVLVGIGIGFAFNAIVDSHIDEKAVQEALNA